MAVTREDVLHVARLARLRLTEDEVERMTVQLNGILAHVGELAEVEIEGVEPAGGATDWPAPLRGEERDPDSLDRDPSELAPAWDGGFFTVPRLAALDAAEPEVPSEPRPLPGAGDGPQPDRSRGRAEDAGS